MKGPTTAAALSAVVCLASGLVAGAASYSVIDLGSTNGYYSTARAINNSNAIVYTEGGSIRLWQNGAVSTISGPTGATASVCGINNNGQVAGSEIRDYSRAFIHSGGVSTLLGSFNSNGSSDALDLNDAGQVVGFSYAAQAFKDHAFLYDPVSGMTDLHSLGSSSIATCINSFGEVAGYYSNYNGTEVHAFIWRDGSMNTIDGMSDVRGINDLGMVVGQSRLSEGTSAASFWQNGNLTVLGTLGGAVSAARAANSSAWVVGWANTANNQDHGFLWRGGPMIDVNSLIDGSSGWTVRSILDINDNGWMVGQGTSNGTNHAIALVPVPEPASASALAAGAAGLAICRRRKK